MEIGSRVKLLIEDVINKEALVLDECIYEKENNVYYLRVIIDKEPVANLDDCILVNNLISPILEDLDYLSESYILDVATKQKGIK